MKVKCIKENPKMLYAESRIDSQIREFIHVKVNGVNIKLLMYAGSDSSIINTDNGNNIRKPMLSKTAKIVRSMTDDNLYNF